MLPTGPGRRASFPLCARPSSCPVLGWPPPDHPERRAALGATGTLAGEAAGQGVPDPAVPWQLSGPGLRSAQVDLPPPPRQAPRPSLNVTTKHPNQGLPQERPRRVCSLSNRLKRVGHQNVSTPELPEPSTLTISLGWAVGTRSWRNSRQAVFSAPLILPVGPALTRDGAGTQLLRKGQIPDTWT